MGGVSSGQRAKGKGQSLVFFGNERLATGVSTTAPTLQALIAAGYDVKAVVSNYERGTSRNARELEIKEVADKNGIPLLLPDKPVDIIYQLKSFSAEVAVLVAYGRIVPQEIIDVFPKGIINIHPSLLPLHRGPIPLESVILNGEVKTGVSVMQLVKAMDAGPVYGQTEVLLNGNETKQELADKLLEIGVKMVIELLPGILNGSVISKPQDDTKATYDKMIGKADGIIDWHKTAEQLEREIKAYAVWPKSYTSIAKREVILTSAHVDESPKSKVESRKLKPGEISITEDKELAPQTDDGLLIVDKLKPAGKKEMSAKEFLSGYGKNL